MRHLISMNLVTGQGPSWTLGRHERSPGPEHDSQGEGSGRNTGQLTQPLIMEEAGLALQVRERGSDLYGKLLGHRQGSRLTAVMMLPPLPPEPKT